VTREEWIAEAWPVFRGLKARRERVRVPTNIDLAEDDARKLMYEARRLINEAMRGSGRLDNADFISEARRLEDEARDLIAD